MLQCVHLHLLPILTILSGVDWCLGSGKCDQTASFLTPVCKSPNIVALFMENINWSQIISIVACNCS